MNALLLDDERAAAAPQLVAAKLTASTLGVLIAALTREHGHGRRVLLGLAHEHDRAAHVLVALARALQAALVHYLNGHVEPETDEPYF
ncbi:MAG TPA: hypothetical protein VI072_06985 [Polyangiaceae bacterium]